MIRILHVVHALTRGGGLSNVVMNYYRFIDRSKVQFDFLYFRDSEDNFIEEIESLGGRCFRMNNPSITLSYLKERDGFFKLHQNEWKAIHCHALFAVSALSKSARKYGADYIIAHSHSTEYGTTPLKRIRNRIFIKQACNLSDYHFACSKKAGKFIFGSDGFTVLNNAVDSEKYKFSDTNRIDLRRELEIESKYVVGHVGGFCTPKNHVMLIDIFNEVLKHIPSAVLLLIGGDGLVDSTKQATIDKIIAYGIKDHVKFLGLREDVDRILSAMDIYVMPSLFEGLPVSCVEAQTNGLPCVLSDRITSEIGIYKTRFLSLTDSPEVWANHIVEEYNKMVYTNTHRLDGQKALEYAGYNIRNEAQKLQQFYITLK